jgi:diacylglycerol kinase family enzyme
VVAGGDGTVGKVAKRLDRQPYAIAILLLGIANNVAKTLGLEAGSLQDLIKRWKTARCVNFDAGMA